MSAQWPNRGGTAEGTSRPGRDPGLPPAVEKLDPKDPVRQAFEALHEQIIELIRQNRREVETKLRTKLTKIHPDAPDTLGAIADDTGILSSNLYQYRKVVGVRTDGLVGLDAVTGAWDPENAILTRTDATTFVVEGDRSTYYTQGRKLRFNEIQGASYLVVASSTYSAVNDRTTVIVDPGYSLPQTFYTLDLGVEPKQFAGAQIGSIINGAVDYSSEVVVHKTFIAGLVPNGNFQRTLSGTIPADWILTGAAALDTATSESGDQSLKLTNTDTAKMKDFYSVSPNLFYVLQAHVKTSGSVTVQIGVECFNSAKVSLGIVNPTLNEAVNFSGFRRVFMLIQGEGADPTNFKAGTKFIKIFLKHNGAANNLWIDNVIFKPATDDLIVRFGSGIDGILSTTADTTLSRASYEFRSLTVNAGHTLKVQPGTIIKGWRMTINAISRATTVVAAQ